MGFRVALTYKDGEGTDGPSICILVQCPADLIGRVEGGAAYLWIGDDRFELGQFDADGKAIGLLPARRAGPVVGLLVRNRQARSARSAIGD